VKAYGALVSWPSRVVPSRNSTFVTFPPGSLAVAVIVIVGFHEKVAPLAGEVMLTIGGEVLTVLTMIVDGALVVPTPKLSVARAVTV
jgi:hypothetical protein